MDLDAALALLAQEPDPPLDLAELALELARDEYPDLDVEAYLTELAAISREAAGYVRGTLDVRVAGLCRYLFHELGFHGNTAEYDDPRNSYLNQVLDRRTGIPITLSAIAMAVGARVGLRVEGVGLPGHFVAKAVEGGREVLFDPFHGGRLLSPEECETLVRRVTGAPFQATAEALARVPLALVVRRMLSNLKAIYLRGEDFPRAARVTARLRQLDPADPSHERDLGVALLRAGQPGKAVDYLSAYLAGKPAPDDADAVRRLLERARHELSRWN